MATKKLTKKQKIFVEEFVATGVGVKAAKKAYKIKATDPKKADLTARVIASENLTKPNIQSAIQEALPDDLLGRKHQELLNSTTLDHMVFPLGPKDEDDINLSGGRIKKTEEGNVPEKLKERTTLTDKEIITMLADVNCKVRRIVHGETARHVYFWAADNRAVKDALDMAYKLKGKYAAEKSIVLNIDAAPNPRLQGLATKLNEKRTRK
jgi:hypothetical protein